MNSTRNRQDIFLYEMPAKERFDLCKILDQNNTWVVLAEHMNYGQTDIEVREALQMTILKSRPYDDDSIASGLPLPFQEIRRTSNGNSSPTNELMSQWGQLNHTVTEMFALLFR